MKAKILSLFVVTVGVGQSALAFEAPIKLRCASSSPENQLNADIYSGDQHPMAGVYRYFGVAGISVSKVTNEVHHIPIELSFYDRSRSSYVFTGPISLDGIDKTVARFEIADFTTKMDFSVRLTINGRHPANFRCHYQN